MGANKNSGQQYFEMSGRFREAVLARIDRLERDASEDARLIPQLLSEAHQHRIATLVAGQIEEAIRLRASLSTNGITVAAIDEVRGQHLH